VPAASAATTASQGGAGGAVAAKAKGAEASDMEAEYAMLSQQLQPGSAQPPATLSAPAAQVVRPSQHGVPTFSLAEDGDDDALEAESEDMHFASELRQPQIPPPLEHFTAEDLGLRQALQEFYLQYNPDNIVNLNTIVGKYAGRNVSHLWASLALKYDLPAREAIEWLSRSTYGAAAYEYDNEDQAILLEEALKELSGADAGKVSRTELLQRAIRRGASDGSDGPLRMLAFRGIPDESALRPQIWKALLGYLPMARHSEWGALQGEKRALYASYKQEMLSVSEDHQVEVQDAGAKTAELKELLQEIKNDVDRTRREFEFFRRPATRGALLALLFVYARLNPGVRYVQGMNEIGAVLLWVMSVDHECAEADAFWCFSELLVEIKEGFMQALDHTGEGVHGLVAGVTNLLRMYDPELARHLQRCDLPPVVFLVRWCTVLFAQDATLPDLVRLWDSFIGDPRRFQFVIHICLALIMSRRDDLLLTDKQFELAEVLQAAPREADFEVVLRKASAICAFERRAQTPPFPPKPKPQVVEDFSEWAENAARVAQEAAFKASVTADNISRRLEETIAPAVVEKVGQAGDIVAVAASEAAQKAQDWLEETAPARKEALDQASRHLSSLWTSVRATGAAAASRGERLAEEYKESGAAEAAAARLSGFSGTASSFWARTTAAAAAFAAEPSAPAAAPAAAAAGGSQARLAQQQPVPEAPQAAAPAVAAVAAPAAGPAAAPKAAGVSQGPMLITADAIPEDEV